MIRRGLLPMMLLLSSVGIQAAQASGDFGCGVTWSLKQDGLDGCNNLPFLSPANDSRVNLLLLLLDEGHAKFRPSSDEQAAAIWSGAEPIPFSTFTTLLDTQPVAGQPDTGLSQGEGSRCVSNDTSSGCPMPRATSRAQISECGLT